MSDTTVVGHEPGVWVAGCACSACAGGGGADPAEGSIDGQGGTVAGKPVWTAEQVADWLNRSGSGWGDEGVHQTPSSGDVDVIRFGFHTGQQSLFNNGYVYARNGQLFGLAEYFNFAGFSEAQKAAAREAMQAWDDVMAPSLVESAINDADITFANLASAPTTQAYAYLPNDLLSSNPVINPQIQEIGGDIWVSASQASNFRLDEGGYGIHTLVHEIGHSLGLSHPGAYNAAPGVTITYGANAEYAQDTRAYTVMSYFEASALGARHFDFNISTTVYAATPLIHDIAAIQALYGADMTTRTGDTVYGFNSNAGRDSFDFTKTPAPVAAIWDAGGIDTIDASGYATEQLIDLTPGSLSSIGGVTFDTAPSFEQVNANRAAAGLPPITLATYNSNMAVLAANPVVGRLTDNFGIAYGVTIENAVGGSGKDRIIGNTVDNSLKGNAGDDTLEGRGGNDTLDGGVGADRMLGGTGDDRFLVDQLGDLTIETAGEGIDTVRASLDWTLAAEVENLELAGAAIVGVGNELDNFLLGNGNDNQLSGGAGDDRLAGGDGVDHLTGGAGSDTFVAEINATLTEGKKGAVSLDVIWDFDQAGDDLIDLSGLDANSLVEGHQAFNFGGKGAGSLTVKTVGSWQAAESVLGLDLDGLDTHGGGNQPMTLVFGDTDGDNNPDFVLVLVGSTGVSAGDFLFG